MNYLFTKISFEEYTEPISEELKNKLRIDELKSIGYLQDDSETYTSEEELRKAFKENLE